MKKIILDLDTGVDDSLAIAYALGSPELELIAITGTYGNVVLPLGMKNSLQITELLGHPEVKVFPEFHIRKPPTASKRSKFPNLFTARTESAISHFPNPHARQNPPQPLISLLKQPTNTARILFTFPQGHLQTLPPQSASTPNSWMN